ncbi:MAG: endolytic transglycosylase MltG [Patescibacteria group bacterium]
MTNFFSANRVFFYTLGVITFLIFFYALFLNAPADFPSRSTFKIEEGSTLRSVSWQLKEAHIIRSRLAFEAFVILFGRKEQVIEADYYFENKLPVFEVARRISNGEHHMAPIVVTIPEGFNTMQIADTVSAKLLNFDKSRFIKNAAGLEGYLFPDTYYFLTTDDDVSVLSSMRENFKKKILSIRSDIDLSDKKEKDIIIMASLIEGEAKGDADRGFISGILWKRLSIGMPLQVDAALETYKVRGLPKSPIGNPGMQAILAALHPQNSSYLYYLHDKDGNIHYARTFAEHRANVLKYLK